MIIFRVISLQHIHTMKLWWTHVTSFDTDFLLIRFIFKEYSLSCEEFWKKKKLDRKWFSALVWSGEVYQYDLSGIRSPLLPPGSALWELIITIDQSDLFQQESWPAAREVRKISHFKPKDLIYPSDTFIAHTCSSAVSVFETVIKI